MSFVSTEEKHYPDIDVTDFISHVKSMHMDGDIGFSQEFDVSGALQFSVDVSPHPVTSGAVCLFICLHLSML